MYDYELFLEDEERAKRNLEEFKKKYNYDPKTKTIEYIKGRRIPFRTDGGEKVPEVTPFAGTPHAMYPMNRSTRKHLGCKLANISEIPLTNRTNNVSSPAITRMARLRKKKLRDNAKLYKSYVNIDPRYFDMPREDAEFIADHEIGHIMDITNGRKDARDHSSLVHKYDSGTDLSKLPKDIRRERLKVKKQERDLKKEKNPVKKVIKNDKYVRDRDKVLNKLENHVKSTNDETAKAILQHRKDTRNAKRQAVKNALVTNFHDQQYPEIIADTHVLRNANDKNIKKNSKRLKTAMNNLSINNLDTIAYSPISTHFRAQNAKKVAKMQESVYNMIIEALQEQIDDGEITLEFAEAVNDLAYEKYMM